MDDWRMPYVYHLMHRKHFAMQRGQNEGRATGTLGGATAAMFVYRLLAALRRVPAASAPSGRAGGGLNHKALRCGASPGIYCYSPHLYSG